MSFFDILQCIPHIFVNVQYGKKGNHRCKNPKLIFEIAKRSFIYYISTHPRFYFRTKVNH